MIWKRVMQLEWKVLRRDKSVLLTLLVFGIFLVLASLSGGEQSRTLEEGLTRSQQEESERFENHASNLKKLEASKTPLKSSDPRDAVWMGKTGGTRLAVLPPGPLAPIATGLRDIQPQAVRVTMDVALSAERERETPLASPTRKRSGTLDPAFLFIVLFPLVVIALSYEILSGERERGTLTMLLSHPVSQTQLVLGKAGARALLLTVVTLLSAAIGLTLAGVQWTSADTLVYFGLYSSLLVCWALLWFALAIAVNAWSVGSARNALMLVGFWLLFVVVIPGLVQVSVDTLYPPVSRIEVLHEAREATRDVESQLNAMEGRHDIDPKAQGYAAKVIAVQEKLSEKLDPMMAELKVKQKERQGVLTTLQYISPAIVVQIAMEDIAGSGVKRQDQFQEQLDDFHKEFRTFFVERIKTEKEFSGKDLAEIPAMAFVEEPIGNLIQGWMAALLYLLLGTALCVAVALPGLGTIGRLTR